MDPITQGVVGAKLSQSFASKKNLFYAFAIGWLSGMAPDLDSFIRSDTNPLLYLKYHRHFTHSLIFIPFGALFCASILWPFFKKHLNFKSIYIFSFLGYGTHGFIDACTSYGTLLFWPFSDHRVSWNIIAIIDPAFTIPILVLALWSAFKKLKLPIYIGLAWMVMYLSFGVFQRESTYKLQKEVANRRGHYEITETLVKPSIFNLFLWRSVYLYNGLYYVDGLWNFPFSGEKVIKGDKVPKFEFNHAFVPKKSTQGKDILAFDKFSSGYLYQVPTEPRLIGDLRYSLLPHQIEPLWAIKVDPKKPYSHVEHLFFRGSRKETLKTFFEMLKGKQGTPIY